MIISDLNKHKLYSGWEAPFKEFTPSLFTFDVLQECRQKWKIYDGSFSFRFVLDSLLSYTARSAATKLQLKFFKRQSVI